MAFYSSASNASLWRGVDYFDKGKVEEFTCLDDGTIKGIVTGSEGKAYDVVIDPSHPKKSTCNCPFAEGRRVVCKHMIALYFASIPGSREAFDRDMQALEAQYELQEKRWREETRKRIDASVAALSAKEARARLADILYRDALDERYRSPDEYGWW